MLHTLAGVDLKDADFLAQVKERLNELRYSRIAVGKLYLDGDIIRDEAVKRTAKYSLLSEKRASSSISFLEQYRAYGL